MQRPKDGKLGFIIPPVPGMDKHEIEDLTAGAREAVEKRERNKEPGRKFVHIEDKDRMGNHRDVLEEIK